MSRIAETIEEATAVERRIMSILPRVTCLPLLQKFLPDPDNIIKVFIWNISFCFIKEMKNSRSNWRRETALPVDWCAEVAHNQNEERGWM